MEKIINLAYLLPVIILSILHNVFGQGTAEVGRSIRLSPFRVKREYITLSGFSSGGNFAQQLYFSYSSSIYGIAVFSHTYYRCGPITTFQEVYDNACTSLGNGSEPYNYNNVFSDISEYYSHGLIDNPTNMRGKPLYIYIGNYNYLFTPEMSLKIRDIFQPYIQNDNEIRTVFQDANLTLPTDNPRLPPCYGPTNDLYLSNCAYAGAFKALQFILGTDAVRDPFPRHQLEPLLPFDQTEFFYGFSGSIRHDMDTIGYLYVPRVCRRKDSECFLHLYFHGCNVGREFVGPIHIQNSGYLEVAEANGIIMLFPQALSSAENEIGCWDTYGFTGPLHATKQGAQITVVRNMLSRIIHSSRIRDEEELPSDSSVGPSFRKDAYGTVSNFFSGFPPPHPNVFRYSENLRY